MGIFSIIKTLLLCAASLTILLASPSSAKCKNYLLSGKSLRSGESLITGQIKLDMQQDCNLVLKDNDKPIWASHTEIQGASCFLSMQSDGNLVVYGQENDVIWASNTDRENGSYILLLQKDRNLVIYSTSLWATQTECYPCPPDMDGISGAK